jgi:protein involved in polysaccharide export with SLBB domain
MQGSPLATHARCHLARGVSRVSLARALWLLCLAFATLSLTACGRNYPPPPNLPEPVVNLQVGPGDVLEVVILGEEKLPKDYEVQPDGSLDFPYTGKAIKVAGLEPRAIATAIRDQLVESKFLVSPQVQVKVKAFNSKMIQIIGQISKPGPLPYQDGMTLVQAISAAGWFTPLADTNHVQLIRIVHGENNKSVNAIISVDAITDNARADVKLQQGDTIKVDQRLF